MGIEGNDTVSTHGGIPQDRDVTCAKCGLLEAIPWTGNRFG